MTLGALTPPTLRNLADQTLVSATYVVLKMSDDEKRVMRWIGLTLADWTRSVHERLKGSSYRAVERYDRVRERMLVKWPLAYESANYYDQPPWIVTALGETVLDILWRKR